MKGEKEALLLTTNLTSICYFCKEKIVKNDSCWRTQHPIQIHKEDATFNSDRQKINLFPNKSFRYYKQKSLIIFRRIRIQLIFHNILLIWFLKKYSAMALDFQTFLENMKKSSLLSKILETGINIFKSNSRMIKKWTIYYTPMRRKTIDDYWL